MGHRGDTHTQQQQQPSHTASGFWQGAQQELPKKHGLPNVAAPRRGAAPTCPHHCPHCVCKRLRHIPAVSAGNARRPTPSRADSLCVYMTGWTLANKPCWQCTIWQTPNSNQHPHKTQQTNHYGVCGFPCTSPANSQLRLPTSEAQSAHSSQLKQKG